MRKWALVRNRISDIENLLRDRLAGWLLIILSILLIIFTIVTLSLAATYISTVSNLEPFWFLKEITDLFISIIFPNLNLTNIDEYVQVLSLILNALIVIITLLFAFLPIFTIHQFRTSQNKTRNIKSYLITEIGKQDLHVMYDNFQGAEEVTVHSGDFSWVSTDQELQRELLRLAKENKLTLISYRTRDEVMSSFGDHQEIFNLLTRCFHFESQSHIKCSLVKRHGGSKVFLYRCDIYENGHSSKRVFELIDSNETRYLLEVLDHLIHPPSVGNQI